MNYLSHKRTDQEWLTSVNESAFGASWTGCPCEVLFHPHFLLLIFQENCALLMFHADPICLPPSNFSFQPSCLTTVFLTGLQRLWLQSLPNCPSTFPKCFPFFLFPCSLCSQCSGSQTPCQVPHPNTVLIFCTAGSRPPTPTLCMHFLSDPSSCLSHSSSLRLLKLNAF